MKNKLNIAFLVLYLISFLLWKEIGFQFAINFFGFAILLFLIPYNILSGFRFHFSSKLETVLAEIITYFTFVVPIYYLLNKIGFKIDVFNILTVWMFSWLLVFFFSKENGTKWKFDKLKIIDWIEKNYLFILAILFFVVIHFINFQFYKFIPEGDGYLDMVKINKTVSSGFVSVTFRPFFNMAMALIVSFAKIDTYFLFSFWMVGIETTLIAVIYLLLRKYEIKNELLRLVILLAALAVPVINMEMDSVRPQTIFIILFPIYLYFASLAFKEKNKNYFALSSLIAVFGLNYHEFFIFILLVHLLTIAFLFVGFVYHNKTRFLKPKYLLLFVVVAIALFVFWKIYLTKSSVFLSAVFYFKADVLKITFLHWRWWFINNYPAENISKIQLGWPGLWGAAKYYGYYLSPSLMFIFLCIFIFLSKTKSGILKKDFLVKLAVPFIILFLFFAEILPRISNPLVPERLWLLIDLALLAMFVPFSKQIERLKHKTILISTWMFLVVVGLGGSFYVAHGKNQTLISVSDLEAKKWIDGNSNPDTIFLTQSSNDALFAYYFERKYIANFSDRDLENLKAVKDKYSAGDLYFYYSNNRFNNLYVGRLWWRAKNYYGLDVNKFNHLYSLVYQKDDVYIWKID